MNRRAGGFTLMELLIAVSLTVMLVGVMAAIFFRSADVVMTGEARISVACNSRNALDKVTGDLENLVPTVILRQRFHLVDGTDTPGAMRDCGEAKDYAGMMTLASVPVGGDRKTQTVFVEYYLAPEGDTEIGASGVMTTGVRSDRNLKVLRRRVWAVASEAAMTPLLAGLKDGAPLDPAAATGAGMTLLEEGDLCHWVISFNLEVYAADTYFQLHEGGSNPYAPSAMPIGDLATDPGLPRKMRVTLRVIEGAAERTERLAQREIWLPVD